MTLFLILAYWHAQSSEQKKNKFEVGFSLLQLTLAEVSVKY